MSSLKSTRKNFKHILSSHLTPKIQLKIMSNQSTDEKKKQLFHQCFHHENIIRTPSQKKSEAEPEIPSIAPPSKCNIFGKSFSRSRDIKIHMKTVHEGQKNYNCDSCDKSFTLGSNLKRHFRIVHEGQKDYKCVSCEKSFITRSHFKRHFQSVHEGRKEFKCDSCDKSFSRKDSFKRHLKDVHEG